MSQRREYIDLNLELRDLDVENDTFKLAVLPSPEVGETQKAIVVPYDKEALQGTLDDLERKRLRLEDLIELGEAFAERLLPSGQARDLFRAALQKAGRTGGVRIRLLIREPRLAQLPWEFTYFPIHEGEKDRRHFLVLNPQISMVRHEALAEEHPTLEAETPEKLRLVVAMTNAKGYRKLKLDREKGVIEEALREFDVDGVGIEWEPFLEDVTSTEVIDALQEGADLFYFAGHGTFEEQDRDPETGDPIGVGRIVILKDKETKEPFLWNAGELAIQLQKANVRLAIFGACDAGRRDGVNAWTGIAPAVIERGVPAVVAMQYEVLDDHATAFSRAFFAGLAGGLSVDEAVAAGRLAMLGESGEREFEWGVPVLYMRSPNGIIFPKLSERETEVADRLRRDAQKNIDLNIHQEVTENWGQVIGAQIKTYIAEGGYLKRDEITNNIIVMGDATPLDEILRNLLDSQGVDENSLRNLGALVVPENVSNQITELFAAQKEVEARGIPASPQALFRLGMLAAYRREYDSSLAYFRQSAQADPEYSEAFEAISWLQQSLAMSDIQKRNYDDAIVKLADARSASSQTDPLDPQALALRGYISKSLAQIAGAKKDSSDQMKYNKEAARFFAHTVQLDPGNASAHNGLGNVEYALGNIDDAISAFTHAIELMPAYTAAHHDLALAFELKMKSDPDNAASWCQKAISSWQQAYKLAPDDPGFTADKILSMGQRISWLEQQCG